MKTIFSILAASLLLAGIAVGQTPPSVILTQSREPFAEGERRGIRSSTRSRNCESSTIATEAPAWPARYAICSGDDEL